MSWYLPFLVFAVMGTTPLAAIEIPLESIPKEKPKKANMKGPVILDTRSALEFGFGRLEKSAPIRWEDYSQTETPAKSLLDSDIGLLARKLRLFGINPQRPVVVVGKGKDGDGAEGRIAWMLSYLGVKSVEIERFENMKVKRTTQPWEGNLSVGIWLPKPQVGYRATKEEILDYVTRKSNNVVIVDVRSADEFNGKVQGGAPRSGKIPGAVHFSWENCFSETGSPASKKEFISNLKKAGIETTKRLIFVSEMGLKSGYCFHVARKAGLTAQNYEGSMWDWFHNTAFPVEK